MKIFTSYFYQIRFFKPYMIPLSTAVWSPKWWNPVRVDSNGVVVGLNIKELSPHIDYLSNKCRGKDGIGVVCNGDPSDCDFLKLYEYYLNNEINFEKLINKFNNIGNEICKDLNHEPYIVLIVYEKPDNRCSERVVLQKYFKNNGYECKELNPKYDL